MGVWLGPMGSKEFYKYTGVSQFSQSGNNWEIKLLSGTSATFKFNKDPGEVDMFLVGAGAPGTGGRYIYTNATGQTQAWAGKGGNGGECKTIQPSLQKRTLYTVTIGIGENGTDTSFRVSTNENYIALGGSSTWPSQEISDSRKQGGVGAWELGNMRNVGHNFTYPSSGENGYYAFGETIGSRYGAGGGGGGATIQYVKTGETQASWTDAAATPSSGGTTGGGKGGTALEGTAGDGDDATFYGAGGGGGGASGTYNEQITAGGKGGNGIIIIRNHRSS